VVLQATRIGSIGAGSGDFVRVLRYLIVLLTEPGQGWLRWATETRTSYPPGWYGPPESYLVAPPLRRAWWCVAFWIQWIVNYRELRDDSPFDWTPTKGFFRDENRPSDLRNAWLGYYHEPRWYGGHDLGLARGILIGLAFTAAVVTVAVGAWGVLTH
jgi:hypothetical protein